MPGNRLAELAEAFGCGGAGARARTAERAHEPCGAVAAFPSVEHALFRRFVSSLQWPVWLRNLVGSLLDGLALNEGVLFTVGRLGACFVLGACFAV